MPSTRRETERTSSDATGAGRGGPPLSTLITMRKLLSHLISVRDQSATYTGYPHYGPLRIARTVGTKPPTYDPWAHELRLPLKYSTAAR